MNNPPPLGNNLFSALAKYSPNTWGNLPDKFRVKFDDNRFEKGVEEIYGVYPQMIVLLNRMGRYFSIFRIDNLRPNLYHMLFQRFQQCFESHEFLISTINYECLIEMAACPFFPKITYWGPSDGLRVLKLHGSCNFHARKFYVSPHMKFILGTSKINTPLQAVPIQDVILRLKENQMLPAMSLYASSKKNIVGEATITKIQAEFHEAVKLAELVVIIGANPYPDDHHIWDHVRETQAKVVMIANEAACSKWLDTSRRGKPSRWVASTFADGFRDLCDLLPC
jgi:hypothetical protein